MQKIIKQDLTGALLSAQRKAKYTWKKGEIAWYFCNAHRDIFKVRFTGDRWLAGNKWGYEKIYQYKHLESSGDHDLSPQPGIWQNHISHGNESEFYSTKKEAFLRGMRFLGSKKKETFKEISESATRLKTYYNK